MSPRADNVTIYRDMAVQSLEWTMEGLSYRESHTDPLWMLLPGVGLERATDEQIHTVSEAIGRVVERGNRAINVAFLRSQLRRWAARQVGAYAA